MTKAEFDLYLLIALFSATESDSSSTAKQQSREGYSNFIASRSSPIAST